MHKKHILLFCGGQSSEHEVSLRSAANVCKALNPEKFEISVIGIDHQGNWHQLDKQILLEHTGMQSVESKPFANQEVAIKMGAQKNLLQAEQKALTMNAVDVVFPVLHGPNGEDGTIQGLLRLANLACVGSGVLGSAVCMDKDIAKRLLREAGLPIADFITVRDNQAVDFDAVVKKLGLPFFLKPCNMGSSVGVAKIKSRADFLPALQKAFEHDRKVILEQAIIGQEVECAVLGNEDPEASIVGEIIPQGEFYSYEAKYIDSDGATLQVPARVSERVAKQVQEYAIAAFKTLECHGLARVDFFVTAEDKVIINEVNTLPGFTSISMYPMLWQASGLSYEALIERLVALALERHNKMQALKN